MERKLVWQKLFPIQNGLANMATNKALALNTTLRTGNKSSKKSKDLFARTETKQTGKPNSALTNQEEKLYVKQY